MSDELKMDFKVWVKKYLNGTADKEETNAVEEYYLLFTDAPDVLGFLSESEIEALDKEIQKNIQANISKHKAKGRIVPLLIRYSVAASIVISGFAGLYIYLMSHSQRSANTVTVVKHMDTISNNAVLVIGNGRKIILNGGATERLLAESGTGAVNSGNKIQYGNTGKGNAAVLYNTLYVPRGGRYSVVLQDGTQVVLNASSSLTYPTRFSGAERKVELTGEGYFEVTKDAAHPFIVSTGTSTVKVLGTKFNINAYHHVIRTTLEEGKVLVNALTDSIRLAPGEQATYSASGNISKSNVDVDTYIGWTRDEVIFDEKTTLEDAMEVLGREYNYEISFSDPELKNIKISANINKGDYLLTILDYIKKITNVSFDVNQTNRTVTVKKTI